MNGTFADIHGRVANTLLDDAFIATLHEMPAHPAGNISEIVRMAVAETRWALKLLSRYTLTGKRILEVGSGSGILSACLITAGFDVTPLEPAAEGFSFYADLSLNVFKYLGIDRPILSLPIESLDPQAHGTYDFIFSVNVLEHIRDTNSVLTHLDGLLATDGVMVHTCPNYLIPYEPHFGVALLPFLPGFTRFLLGREITEHAVWKNLNFITYRNIQRAARNLNRSVRFDSTILSETLGRFDSDPEFSGRQQGLPLRLYQIIRALGLETLARYLPYHLQTPMVFEWKK